MALMKCPECGRMISDKAENCPQCGYVLVKNELPKIRRTELHNTGRKNPVLGWILIILSVPGLLFGVCTIFMGIGIILALICGIMFGCGVYCLSTKYEGTCPYCGHKLTITTETIYFCPFCRKRSTRKDGFLETID